MNVVEMVVTELWQTC